MSPKKTKTRGPRPIPRAMRSTCSRLSVALPTLPDLATHLRTQPGCPTLLRPSMCSASITLNLTIAPISKTKLCLTTSSTIPMSQPALQRHCMSAGMAVKVIWEARRTCVSRMVNAERYPITEIRISRERFAIPPFPCWRTQWVRAYRADSAKNVRTCSAFASS